MGWGLWGGGLWDICRAGEGRRRGGGGGSGERGDGNDVHNN